MARKRFGQHFLRDPTVVERIVAAVAPSPGEAIIEIGPGHGELTRALVQRADRLTALEIDRDLAANLRRIGTGDASLDIVETDALGFDYTAHANAQRRSLRIVGNIAYNISSPLVFRLLAAAPAIADVHFMLQKEVVDRIVAEPGSAARGRLSVAVAARADRQRLFDVPATAFKPPPRVTSTVVRIVPRAAPLTIADWAVFDRLLAHAFSRRRKTLRNALAAWASERDLADCGIDPGLRPAALAAADFARVANLVAARRGVPAVSTSRIAGP